MLETIVVSRVESQTKFIKANSSNVWVRRCQKHSLVVQIYKIPYIHACSVIQSCLTLSDPVYCSSVVSSVYVIFQARIMESVAISFSRKEKKKKSQTISRAALIRTLLGQHQYFPEVSSNLWIVNCDARGKHQFYFRKECTVMGKDIFSLKFREKMKLTVVVKILEISGHSSNQVMCSLYLKYVLY